MTSAGYCPECRKSGVPVFDRVVPSTDGKMRCAKCGHEAMPKPAFLLAAESAGAPKLAVYLVIEAIVFVVVIVLMSASRG